MKHRKKILCPECIQCAAYNTTALCDTVIKVKSYECRECLRRIRFNIRVLAVVKKREQREYRITKDRVHFNLYHTARASLAYYRIKLHKKERYAAIRNRRATNWHINKDGVRCTNKKYYDGKADHVKLVQNEYQQRNREYRRLLTAMLDYGCSHCLKKSSDTPKCVPV